MHPLAQFAKQTSNLIFYPHQGYVKTFKTDDDDCAKKIVCEASRECAQDMSQSSNVFCQLGTYVLIISPYENPYFES